METATPRMERTDSTKKYSNNKIRKLNKKKKSLVARQYREKRRKDEDLARRLGREIRALRHKIEEEFKKQISTYWSKKIKSIATSDKNFFPEINRVFRRKNKGGIDTLKTDQNK